MTETFEELSDDQVAPGAADQQVWLDIARCATGQQLERIVRGVRRTRKPAEDETDPGVARWKMRSSVRYDDDGTMTMTVKVPAEQGAVLLAAVDAAREEIDRERACGQDVSAETRSPQESRASIAEGMVRIAQTALAVGAKERPDAARRHRQRLVANVDPISGWARLADGEVLPPQTAPTLDGLREQLRPIIAADLTNFDLGRTSRTLSNPLRQLLGQIDGEHCRFPGCTRTHRLHGHHVEFWSTGHSSSSPTERSPCALPTAFLCCSTGPYPSNRPRTSTRSASSPRPRSRR